MISNIIENYGGISGVSLVEGDIHSDNRGEIWTSYIKNEKINIDFNHDKFSTSKKGVLRGLHGDYKSTKLVSCVKGEVYQVVVDLRENSKTYKKHIALNLSEYENVSVLIPPGCANGFQVVSSLAVYHYKLSYNGEYFDFDKQFTYKWNSQDLNIKWPLLDPILSDRDK